MATKNETKHTPGPWVIDRNPDQRVGTHVRASVPTYHGATKGVSVARITIGGGVADDSSANALLIAAAPEMLEALKALLPFVAAPANPAGASAVADRIAAAHAAIAKAEGR